MASNSEARKSRQLEDERRERIESFCRMVERRRDIAFDALAAVYPSATRAESDALLDQLSDLGASVVVGDA